MSGLNSTLSEFLTDTEKKAIQSCYETILNNMKIDDLLLKLHEVQLISQRDKSNLKAKTDSDKGQFFIDEVLLKSPYPQLCKIRNILITSKIAGHIEIAKLFPTRGEKVSYGDDSPEVGSPNTVSTGFKSATRRASEPINIVKTMTPVEEDNSRMAYDCVEGDSCFTLKSQRVSSFSGSSCSSTPNRLFALSEVDQAQESPGNYQAAGWGSKAANKLLHKTDSHMKHSESAPQLRTTIRSTKLGFYDVKPNNDTIYGESLCVVISNFTGDLLGYRKDVASIVDFHKNTLHCRNIFTGCLPTAPHQEPQSLENLTKEQFMHVLKLIQDFLVNPISGNRIDRFFLYILSHGDKDGIMTCQKGSDYEREENDENGKPIRIKLQEIVDMFTHEKVPFLKGFPKVIFHQACQGTSPLKSAHPVDKSISIHPDKKSLWETPKQKLAIGADIVVCEATSPEKLSWVSDDHGSVFIQNAIQVMQEFYDTEHFYDMMAEVNNRVANNVKRGQDPKNMQKVIEALQMSCVHSTLTKKFYLVIPQD